jgi:energy-coupling factor transporter ATP-binding protein EcfA2
LVLDEPTSAQDLGHRQRVVDRLLLAQRQQGTALLVATHDPELVAALGGPTLPLVPAGPAPTV